MRHIRRWISKLLAVLWAFVAGEEAQRRALARHYAYQALDELKRAGLFKKISLERGVYRIERVRFEEPLIATRDELWCPIDLRRLPTGLVTDDLRKPEIIHALEDRLDTAVWLDKTATGKICFVIRLGGAAFPEIFPIAKFKLPTEAPILAFPLGIDRRQNHAWADLATLPHLLVVGPTGKGKSTFVHTMIATWISRNEPDDMEIWLADHKGGAELNRYRALMPERGRPGIVRRFSYKPEETIGLLEAAQRECERRLEILRLQDCSDVEDYRRQTGERMRRIAIVIDEIFFLMLNREKIDVGEQSHTIAQWAEHLFAKIASAGRAPGIHLVIATQKTGKDVLTGLITANFETRVVFGLADMYQSIYLLGNASAKGMPKGRIVYSHEGDQREMQSPLITAQQTRLTINRIQHYGIAGGLGGSDDIRRLVEEAKLLIAVSVERLGGKFDRRTILQLPEIKGVITKNRFLEIAERLRERGIIIIGGRGKPTVIAPAFADDPNLVDMVFRAEFGPTVLRPGETKGETSEDTEKLGLKQDHDSDATREGSDLVLVLEESSTTMEILELDPLPFERRAEVPVSPRTR